MGVNFYSYFTCKVYVITFYYGSIAYSKKVIFFWMKAFAESKF